MPDHQNSPHAAIETARSKFKKKIQSLRSSTRQVLTDIESERESQKISSIRKNIERQ